MSWQPAIDPQPGDTFTCDAIDMVIVPRPGPRGFFRTQGSTVGSETNGRAIHLLRSDGSR